MVFEDFISFMEMVRIQIVFFVVVSFTTSGQNWKALNQGSIAAYRAGEYEKHCMDAAQTEYGANSIEFASSLTNKAYSETALGDYLSALRHYKDAATICFDVYERPHESQIQALGELAKTFTRLGVYDSSQHYVNMAKSVYLAIPTQNRSHYDTSFYSIEASYLIVNSEDAAVHHRLGQIDEAIQLLESQVPIFMELYPDTYQSQRDYHTTINNLFTYNNEAMNLESAKAYAFHYYELTKDRRTAERVHALQENLGSVYNNLEAYDSALFYWHRALSTIEGTLETNSYVHTAILNNMGTLVLQNKMYDSAIFYLRKSYSIQREKEALQPNLYQIYAINLAESFVATLAATAGTKAFPAVSCPVLLLLLLLLRVVSCC